METIQRNDELALELAFARMALRVVDDTIARLTPRKLKSFEELAKLHEERRELTRRVAGAMLSLGSKVQHDLDVFYIVAPTRAIRVPSLSDREWGA